ncbi:hypothetical protein ACUTAF_03385 [Pseudomonas sp. SP16.1]|uniref:hypothetical protein n=1 Tax=Pseudomonas sp. SP16.1 TaxID=3458854 RepID=UPI0040460204
MNARAHPAPAWRESAQATPRSCCAHTEVEAGYLLPQLLASAELPAFTPRASTLARLWCWLGGARR